MNDLPAATDPAPAVLTPPGWARDWVGSAITAKPEGVPDALTLRGVTLSFGGVTALLDVDLCVARGEIRAIIGPNGAGKSSIVNLISGVCWPDHGKIWIGGQKFATVPTDDLARLGVAWTLQNLALFKGLTVRENVIVGRAATIRSSFVEQVLGVGRVRAEEEEVRAHATDAIELLHLSAVADHRVSTSMSCQGGESPTQVNLPNLKPEVTASAARRGGKQPEANEQSVE